MTLRIIKIVSIVILTVSAILGLLYDFKVNEDLNDYGKIALFLIILSSLTGIIIEVVEYRKERKKEIDETKQYNESQEAIRKIEGLQTGGETFCYWMLFNFNLEANYAREFCFIKEGQFPLYEVNVRIVNMDTHKDLYNNTFREINSRAILPKLKWPLPEKIYYRIFFIARNGSWHQDLILCKSLKAQCWLPATIIKNRSGEIVLSDIDELLISEFGEPQWRD